MHQHERNRKPTYAAAAAVAVAVAVAGVMFAGAPLASAVPRTINVVAGQNLYAPQNLGIITAGDAVTWVNDSVHDIRSASIPAGATAWVSPIQSGAVSFSQTVTAPGNYRYYCSIHSSAAAANAATQSPNEMVGQFTVL
jgi:plastocyanin